jgi:hypothetical protein
VQILQKPVEAAKKAGKLRKDYDAAKDLSLLVRMLGVSMILVSVIERKAHAKRTLQLMLEGIKTKT